MTTSFDPAEIDVIEDDYTSNLSYDESENASTRRILGLCEYARELESYLHSIQKHPDYQYAMTFENKDGAHQDMTGWVRNPALVDAWHGNPGQEALRQETNPRASKELYWMRLAR
jgi:hypothetical protein